MRRRLLALLVLLAVVPAVSTTSLSGYSSLSGSHATVGAAAVFPGPGGGLSVQAFNAAPADHSQVNLRIQVTNTGTAAVDLSQVVVRYWFTNDAATGTSAARCNWSPLPGTCANVNPSVATVEPTRVGGDRVMEVRFGAVQLAAGATTGQIDLQIYRNASSEPYVYTNDHSQVGASLADVTTITAYLAGTLAWGTEPAVEPPRDGVLLRYANLNPNTGDNAVNPGLEIVNTGNRTLDLSRVTLRYWFTRDGGADTFQVWFDHQPAAWTGATASVHNLPAARAGADAYLEVSPASRTLAPNASTDTVRLRFSKTDWSNFDEVDDYSYGANTTLQESTRVTAYLDGQLVWGAEP